MILSITSDDTEKFNFLRANFKDSMELKDKSRDSTRYSYSEGINLEYLGIYGRGKIYKSEFLVRGILRFKG